MVVRRMKIKNEINATGYTKQHEKFLRVIKWRLEEFQKLFHFLGISFAWSFQEEKDAIASPFWFVRADSPVLITQE